MDVAELARGRRRGWRRARRSPTATWQALAPAMPAPRMTTCAGPDARRARSWRQRHWRPLCATQAPRADLRWRVRPAISLMGARSGRGPSPRAGASQVRQRASRARSRRGSCGRQLWVGGERVQVREESASRPAEARDTPEAMRAPFTCRTRSARAHTVRRVRERRAGVAVERIASGAGRRRRRRARRRAVAPCATNAPTPARRQRD